MLEEFPEIAHFVTWHRLFWFDRRGFKDNSASARINEDNDSWIAAYLWNKLVDHAAAERDKGRLRLRVDRLAVTCRAIVDQLASLGARVAGRSAEGRNAVAEAWLAGAVGRRPDGRFVLPTDIADAY